MTQFNCSKTLLLILSLLFALGISAEEKRETWLFLGDSITQQGDYVDYIETWYLLNEANAPEMINLGLSSETISGLSESNHAFPRPYLHHRLDKILDRVKPDVVIACYGMNCAIYHPFSEERFSDYQEGINTLISKVEKIGAKMILLTPPPYAGIVHPSKQPGEGESYGYQFQYEGYNEVLQKYADWILSLEGKVKTINTRPGIEKFIHGCYPREPVHPNYYGHELMAESFLTAMGKETGSTILCDGISRQTEDPLWIATNSLVKLQREKWDRVLMTDIGHNNHNVIKRFYKPLSEAQKEVGFINKQLNKIRSAVQN